MKQQNLFLEECGHKNFVESAKIRNNLKAKSKTVQNVHFGNYVKMKGRGLHRILAVATIDCVSTMELNEVKWVKQIIIQGLMCVTVKFDTIISLSDQGTRDGGKISDLKLIFSQTG